MAGRGVDIVLGGNAEGLARHEALAQGVDLESEEGRARVAELQTKFDAQAEVDGDKVRELGGLYVLGSERHESRRIDNQLRGRSGRQGDPGESRFYLSLEDELMRLFATGAMNWVMGKALPEEVPIEAKMVTRAIERAQNTVEARNAEIRKDVLKYDEVMNEQRKVIYARRAQVLDGEDLRELTLDLLDSTIDSLVTEWCATDYVEEWDVARLLTEVSQYFPTELDEDAIVQVGDVDAVTEMLQEGAVAFYERHEESLPGGAETARQLERDIMLQIIDQRWREHLAEMDYLREGINLRAMGQQDPLVAWQREGYSMFGQLMAAIDEDYLRYVLHVEVIAVPSDEPDFESASFQAAEDPVQDAGTWVQALPQPDQEVAVAAGGGGPVMAETPAGHPTSGGLDGASQAPLVKSAREKMGRNEPCWCGSGKKFKLCHGR
jgi:preprotein translocase subunit SecA